jgi:hypothetical protein
LPPCSLKSTSSSFPLSLWHFSALFTCFHLAPPSTLLLTSVFPVFLCVSSLRFNMTQKFVSSLFLFFFSFSNLSFCSFVSPLSFPLSSSRIEPHQLSAGWFYFSAVS